MFSKKSQILFFTFISFMIMQCKMAEQNAPNVTQENPEIENTFRLIEEGEKIVQVSGQHRNVTFIMGNTGAGKSTLLQWITGNTNLTSKETAEGSGEFIIEDGNRIGTTITSKTTFPELVTDKRSHAAFYDCPGFSDTRTSHEIAATYFLKKVADHSANVKILFVVNYPSVSRGVDRQDFMLLMKHATKLIRDIEKYQDSIAIVVTKVNNNYLRPKNSQNSIQVPDTTAISLIAEYLGTALKTLSDKLIIEILTNEEQVFVENTIKLLNIFLQKKGDQYTRIGIFRRPDESGPLTEVQILQEGQLAVWKILYQELKFTPKNVNDFHYSLSDTSKKKINSLIDKINSNVWDQVSDIATKLQVHYELMYYEIPTKVQRFLNNATVEANQTYANEFVRKTKAGQQEISWLILECKNITDVAALGEAIEWRVHRLRIKNCKVNIDRMSAQSKLYAFFKVFSGKELQTRPWCSLFENIESKLASLKEILEKDVLMWWSLVMHTAEIDVSQIIEKMKKVHNNLFEKMYKTINSFVNSSTTVEADKLEAQNFEKSIRSGISGVTEVAMEIKNMEKVSQVANAIQRNLSPLGINEHRSNIENLFICGERLEFLGTLTDSKFFIKPWWHSYQAYANHLADLKKKFNEDAYKIKIILYGITEKHFENIGKAIEDYYEKKVNSTGIEKMSDELLEGFTIVTEWLNYTCSRGNVSKNWNPLFANLYEEIKNSKLATVNVSILQDAFKFKSSGKYVFFLQAFSNSNISICKWLTPLRNSAQNLKDLQIFMKLLRDLYDQFSQYDVQKEKQNYNVADIKDWGRRGETQKKLFNDRRDFKQLLDQIYDADAVGFSIVTDLHMRLVNLALVKTLAGFNGSCSEPDKLVISGDFIKFSDFVNSDGSINNYCKNKINHVNIFAFVVVFLDRDIQANGLQFSIIAPKWEVIGERIINLDGVGGATLPKAKTNCTMGSRGDDGMPGLPGEPGGNFLGIGQKFVNLWNLSISVSGGPGGPGQEGGDGRYGQMGLLANRFADFERQMIRMDKIVTVGDKRVTEQWMYFGKPGKRGGDGGNGGIGGLGGMSGQIRFIPLERTFEVPKTRNEQGPVGKGGEGGKGGDGGHHGNNLLVNYCDGGPSPNWWCSEKYRNSTKQANPGIKGSTGLGSNQGRLLPKQGRDFQSTFKTVLDYKAYVESNSGDIFKTKTLNEFESKIDSYIKI